MSADKDRAIRRQKQRTAKQRKKQARQQKTADVGQARPDQTGAQAS